MLMDEHMTEMNDRMTKTEQERRDKNSTMHVIHTPAQADR